jgi:uncharacterized protein YjbJ (UPF0337 family)
MAERQTEGFLQKIRGKIRSTWGDLTDDDMDRAGGRLDMLIGTIKEKTGEAEEGIRARFERWRHEDEMDGKDVSHKDVTHDSTHTTTRR